MIRKSRSPYPGHVRVTFELPSCVWADRIYLTGDFNNWSKSDLPLRQDRNGVWQAMLDLPMGRRYEFRYLIDGQWRTDSHADGYATNTYGSQNSVVIAELPEEQLPIESTPLIRESQPVRPFSSQVVPRKVAAQPIVHAAA
ncbi:MAG: glycoside hydrolase family 13 [Chloroflexi bacterium]|nr:MAG: glycoside hydrolase family 13 [Chloroflexota bacterium]